MSAVEQLLTPKQLSQLLTVAESTLCDWRTHGKGPRFIPLGRRIGYPESAVNEWLDEQKRRAA